MNVSILVKLDLKLMKSLQPVNIKTVLLKIPQDGILQIILNAAITQDNHLL